MEIKRFVKCFDDNGIWQFSILITADTKAADLGGYIFDLPYTSFQGLAV